MNIHLIGKYEGEARFRPLPDGRWMELLDRYTFVDYKDKRWEVPAGAVVDGASIPRVLWTFMGGPFEGKYRNASIIHDWYCDLRTEPWQDVHHMFYQAMLTSGVSETQATLMYAGVRWAGPRWDPRIKLNIQLITGNRAAVKGTFKERGSSFWARMSRVLTQGKDKPGAIQLELTDRDVEEMATIIGDQNLSLGGIDGLVDDLIAERKPEVSAFPESREINYGRL